jgi:hypothetical protein
MKIWSFIVASIDLKGVINKKGNLNNSILSPLNLWVRICLYITYRRYHTTDHTQIPPFMTDRAQIPPFMTDHTQIPPIHDWSRSDTAIHPIHVINTCCIMILTSRRSMSRWPHCRCKHNYITTIKVRWPHCRCKHNYITTVKVTMTSL